MMLISNAIRGSMLTLLLVLFGCAGSPDVSNPRYAPAEPMVYQNETQTVPTGSIYNAQRNMTLFEDFRARQVGDVVTVILLEATDAAKTSDTNLDKSSSTDLPNPVLAGQARVFGSDSLEFGIESDQTFAGGSASAQSNSLSGQVAVTVAQVLPNGNLYIQGEKWIRINQGDEYIQLRGIIRPIDISANNTVLSTRIADARISYSGTGAPADVNRMGWLSRFFVSPVWPF